MSIWLWGSRKYPAVVPTVEKPQEPAALSPDQAQNVQQLHSWIFSALQPREYYSHHRWGEAGGFWETRVFCEQASWILRLQHRIIPEGRWGWCIKLSHINIFLNSDATVMNAWTVSSSVAYSSQCKSCNMLRSICWITKRQGRSVRYSM